MQLTQTALASASELGSRTRFIASKRHLAGCLLIVVAIASIGLFTHSRLNASSPSAAEAQDAGRHTAIQIYLSAMVLDVAFLRYCWVGVRRRGGSIASLTGGRWASWKGVASDVAIALPFWVVWESAAYAAQRFLGSGTNKALNNLVPRTLFEVATWIVVSIVAGICEEIIFRGYLQQQLNALSGSLVVAVILQGFVFGAVHGYQGWRQALVISMLGILFGILAACRKNLRANMIVHAWSDIWGGWLKAVVWG